MRIPTRRQAWQLAEGLLPCVLVFALLVLDPPPAGVAPWIAKAYAPLTLWALVRQADVDSHLLGVPFRRRRMPTTLRGASMQAALLALTLALGLWPA